MKISLSVRPGANKPIDIIKTLRYATGLGLKHAKDLYDKALAERVEIELDDDRADEYCRVLAGAGCLIVMHDSPPTPAQAAAKAILDVVDAVEARCLAVDGPVTPTLQEITEDEFRMVWKAAKVIADSAR